VIARAHHLQDERLFDCYVAERGGDALDPPAAEHLADCSECAARYAELVRFMDGVRAEAEAETDEIFTPERLHAQQQQVARRVAQLGRTAQIIRFPGRLVSHMNASAARGVTRWVYAAAAAGLVIGVGLGAFYDSDWRLTRRASRQSARQVSATHPIAWAPAATAGTTPAREASDEAFLSDLEVALERPRTRELQAFDALTPHVRDAFDKVR
jgi:anti-sigma factor RsiW